MAIPRSYLKRDKRVHPRYLFRGVEGKATRVATRSVAETGCVWRGILPYAVIDRRPPHADLPREWLGANLRGGWTYWMIQSENRMRQAFLFEYEDDAALFRLFWG